MLEAYHSHILLADKSHPELKELILDLLRRVNARIAVLREAANKRKPPFQEKL